MLPWLYQGAPDRKPTQPGDYTSNYAEVPADARPPCRERTPLVRLDRPHLRPAGRRARWRVPPARPPRPARPLPAAAWRTWRRPPFRTDRTHRRRGLCPPLRLAGRIGELPPP